MANIGVLITDFNNLIENRLHKRIVVTGTKVYEILHFFFRRGNLGINALREMLEEANEDTVEVFFVKKENNLECHICICYEYHDIEIVEYYDKKDISKTRYEIIDTSRPLIEDVKKAFKDLTIQ